MATIYALTKELFNKIHTMWRWQRNIRITGDGVTSNNNENGLTVSIRQKPVRGISSGNADLFKFGRVTTVYSGLGAYSMQPQKVVDAKTYSGPDATEYTNGDAFSNGDYALNLSDNIVYHRVAGAWVNAAGHLTDTDVDVTADFPNYFSTRYEDDIEEVEVIVLARYEALARNQDPLMDRLKVGDFVLARFESTQSDGTDVYAIEGGFRIVDGSSDYQGIYWNSGAWTIDWLRIRNA